MQMNLNKAVLQHLSNFQPRTASCRHALPHKGLLPQPSNEATSKGVASTGGAANQPRRRNALILSASEQPSVSTGPQGSGEASQASQCKLGELTTKLRSLGLVGVVSYGLLNTAYYTVSFLLVWTLVAKVPQGLGAASAVRSFLAVFATVWAGSQVSKVARAAGALFLAPIVDKVMDMLASRLSLKSKQQAFFVIVGSCIGIALLVFGAIVALWC